MKKNGPWTIKSSEVKYKNPWIEVREDQVIRPDGKDGIYGVVEDVPGVSVLAMDDQGLIYLLEEFKYASGKVGIELVSGAIDEGEDALQAAKRELHEEAGLEADTWIDMGAVEPFTSVYHCSERMYLARGLHAIEQKLEGTETIVIRKVPLQEAFDMAMRSEIVHGPSALLILKTKFFLDSEGV